MEAVLAIVVALAVYVLACLIWPYKKCRRCKSGKNPSPSGKFWNHNCGSCGGTGKKTRVIAGALGRNGR